MNTQQLLELLRTWPEFEGRLEWLEQYPPDTPIMDALKDAPHGGEYIDDQWLAYFLWCVGDHLSPLHKQAFMERIREAERERKKAMELSQRKLDAARRLIWNDIRPLMGEEKEKAHRQMIAQAFDEYWKEDHAATYKCLQDTNGLFEAVLEVLYDEHKKFQRALGDVCDDLVGRG